MIRLSVLPSLFFYCLHDVTLAEEACDNVKKWPEADHEVQALEMLQVRSKKGEATTLIDPPSCLGLFVPDADTSFLQISNQMDAESLRLSMGSDSKAKEDTFNSIYRNNVWAHGFANGSTVEATAATRQILSGILGHIAMNKLQRKDENAEIRMLDAACGDLEWMPMTWKDSELIRSGVPLKYHGVDISSEVLARDEAALNSGELFVRGGGISDVNVEFSKLDLSADSIGEYDLIFMKDVLPYLQNDDITKVLNNIKRSGSKYLLTTTNLVAPNREIDAAKFYLGRPINVQNSPFNLDGLVCMDFQASDDSPARLALFDLQGATESVETQNA